MNKKCTLRWTLTMAADEFGSNERTIKSRLNKLGLVAAGDGKYSTQQVHQAACLHDRTARRKAEAEAEQAEMNLAVMKRELVNVRELAEVVNLAIAAIRARILGASNLEAEDKAAILIEIKALWDGAFATPPAPPSGGANQ